jgi:hypothetical protein
MKPLSEVVSGLLVIQIPIQVVCISSYSIHGNYSFLNLEIVANSNSCHNIYLIIWIFAVETIQGRKVFKGRNYMRKYGIKGTYNTSVAFIIKI